LKILAVDGGVEFLSIPAERLHLDGIDADWVSGPKKVVAKVSQNCDTS
jgi:hypothetical protein